MEIFFIMLAVGAALAVKSGWDHGRETRRKSGAAKLKAAEKAAAPKPLSESRKRAVVRRHDIGWWAGELLSGLPVTRTGVHAGWLAHRTAADHQRAVREEARTTHLENRASVLAGLPDHRKRQQDARDAILTAVDGPAPGKGSRKAVRQAADEVAVKRAERQQAGTLPPPLPADAVKAEPAKPGPEAGPFRRRPANPDGDLTAVVEASPAVQGPAPADEKRLSAHVRPGDPLCDYCGGTGSNPDGPYQCPVCGGWGTAAADPDAPETEPGTICNACGNPGTEKDPVLQQPGGGKVHRSEAIKQQEVHADRRAQLTATQGDTVPTGTASDTTYDQQLAAAAAVISEAEQEIARLRNSRITQQVESLASLGLDSGSLGRASEIDESLRAQEKAAQQTLDSAQAFRDGLVRDHGNLAEAHQAAPGQGAEKAFYAN